MRNLKVHDSMRPNQVHARVLRDQADEVPKPLSVILEELSGSGNVLKSLKI